MACRTVFRTVFLKDPWMIPLPRNLTSFPVTLFSIHKTSSSIPFLRCACKAQRSYRRRSQVVNCSSNNENPSSSTEDDDLEQGPPQEVVLKAISEVSKTEGRVGQTTNVVIGGTVHDDSTNEWLALDKKGQVKQKLSSGGKYVSVNIGPIQVVSSEQVQAVYEAMKRDDRMKYFL
ncbi:uncharacterized protein LOC132614924 isoform X2 [Lycium barbarum]|uniref:uncharacterized protein LOC132614924 isoform X2 n=1 Tax=Lycium barbarum TaxID=112863 RepID=UPI00293E02B3|nr:uncharacterized protein LOC132614924 isoform X2 [Lycium barbarum]